MTHDHVSVATGTVSSAVELLTQIVELLEHGRSVQRASLGMRTMYSTP